MITVIEQDEAANYRVAVAILPENFHAQLLD
jgi:hypothetical protein